MDVVFRADATEEIGGGHVMRSLVIANELAFRGHNCIFIAIDGSFDIVPFPAPEVEKKTIPASSYADPDTIKPFIEGADLFFLDSYRLKDSYESEIKKSVKKLVVIDDIPERNHICDLLIDPTFERKPVDYSGYLPKSCQILTGVEYAPLRRQFREKRKEIVAVPKKSRTLSKVLISLGLTDPENDTLKIAEGLSTIEDVERLLEATIVIGKGSKNQESIEEFIKDKAYFSLQQGVEDMAELMVEFDIAIGAGGSTCWERCCLGLPSMIVVQADNQSQITERMTKLGAACNLGRSQYLTSEKIAATTINLIKNKALRTSLAESGARICDGKGAERIATALENLAGKTK